MFQNVSKRAWLQVALAVSVVLATVSAAVMAYGTDSYWARFSHGMGLILFSHRMHWVLAAVAIVFSLLTMGMIIASQRRVWWLLVLLPTFLLFIHRFINNPSREFKVLENPTAVKPFEATTIKDEDWVVGVQFGNASYAYPYAVLYHAPVIIQENRDQRLILMWSVYANYASAYKIDRDVHRSELAVASMPANSLLLYNGRGGQFVSAVSGLTPEGEKPRGFHNRVSTYRMPWKNWRTLHPETYVVPPTESSPTGPLLPNQPMAIDYVKESVVNSTPLPENIKNKGDETNAAIASAKSGPAKIAYVPTTKPIAIDLETLGKDPANYTSPSSLYLLVYRDPKTGLLKAYDRRLKDQNHTFRKKNDAKRPTVFMEDQETLTVWSAEGKAVDGKLKGEQLRSIAIEENLYWNVMKQWMPELEWGSFKKIQSKPVAKTPPAKAPPGSADPKKKKPKA